MTTPPAPKPDTPTPDALTPGPASTAPALTRRAWRIPRAGSLARLALVEEPLPPPAAGEVQVDVAAVGVNFADIFACQGLYSATPSGSFVPGLEAAGTVRAVGAGVTTHRSGDRVIVLTRFGGYASRLNIGAEYLWPLPAGWSFEDGAAYPVQALTAWYGLVELGRARGVGGARAVGRGRRRPQRAARAAADRRASGGRGGPTRQTRVACAGIRPRPGRHRAAR
ncbi:MAG: alcohol dehydrogenase catalytic domain-containing protein [Gammaproteobacteria bacterium]